MVGCSASALGTFHSKQDAILLVWLLTETKQRIFIALPNLFRLKNCLLVGRQVLTQNNFGIKTLVRKCKDLVLHETLPPPNDVRPLSDLLLLFAPETAKCNRFVDLGIYPPLSPMKKHKKLGWFKTSHQNHLVRPSNQRIISTSRINHITQ